MYYVYTNRFQPLSILIEKELSWLSENISENDKIIIGIVNPNPRLADPGDKADTWTRFKIQYNPLSYWERYCLIMDYLSENESLQKQVAMICPLPRPSINMLSASNYLPPINERIMCLQTPQDNDQEDQKRKGLQKQKETIFEIPSYEFGASLTMISPELICCLMALGSDAWTNYVSQKTKKTLNDLNIIDRVNNSFPRNEAIRNLRRIYYRESTPLEQIILYDICKVYFKIDRTVIQNEESPTTVELTPSISELIKNMNMLKAEMETDLPHMKRTAPNTYKKNSQNKDKLANIIERLEKNLIDEAQARQVYEMIIEEWDNRKSRMYNQ